MQHHPDLIEEIDAFLEKTKMGETYFGRKAARNTELVKRLKNGKRIWPETEQAVRDFISKNDPSVDAPSSEGADNEGSLPAIKRGHGDVSRQGPASEKVGS